MAEPRPKKPRGAAPGAAPLRGRPTPSRVAEIDRGLVATARAMFIENGYAITSMEAVAVAAGVSKGTLYARYPAKPDLFRAVVADRLRAWAADVPRAVDDMSEVSECLLRNGASFFAAMRNPEVAAFDRLILAEAGRFPELAAEFHHQGYSVGVAGLAGEMERAADPAQPIADAPGLARTFTAALLGWWRTEALVSDPTPERCDAFLSKLVRLLMEGRAAW